MNKKILIIGDSGMLGSKLISFGKSNNLQTYGCSRNSKDIKLDITNIKKTNNVLNTIKPNVIINTAAEINLKICEKNLHQSLKINSFAVKNLSEWSDSNKCKLVQISTDQFYSQSKKKKHRE